MFETLNDRGARANQADLIKNHLLRHAGDRKREAQQRWAHMRGTIETIGDENTILLYLRHLMVTRHGPTKERDLFERVETEIESKASALAFADWIAEGATDYVALFNPEHSKWNDYGPTTRQCIRIMLDLQVEQIRPLMFAVARRFSISEAQKAFRLFVSWSVRFLVVGGRGGLLDRHYADRAKEIGTGEVTTAKELAKKMDIVPTDAVFQAAFSDARVSNANLARYYLRALELANNREDQPELVPNDNQTAINLEHVLPENPGPGWSSIDPEDAPGLYRRIGNLVLLKERENVRIGNHGFPEKQKVLAASKFRLTNIVA